MLKAGALPMRLQALAMPGVKRVCGWLFLSQSRFDPERIASVYRQREGGNRMR